MYVVINSNEYIRPLFFIDNNGAARAIQNRPHTKVSFPVFVCCHDNPTVSFEQGFEHCPSFFEFQILGKLNIM